MFRSNYLSYNRSSSVYVTQFIVTLSYGGAVHISSQLESNNTNTLPVETYFLTICEADDRPGVAEDAKDDDHRRGVRRLTTDALNVETCNYPIQYNNYLLNKRRQTRTEVNIVRSFLSGHTVSVVCPTTQTARQSDDCITEVRVTQPSSFCLLARHSPSPVRSLLQGNLFSTRKDRKLRQVRFRFCGPATTVTVPCTCPPRVSVKTLGQAQVHLLHTAPPRVYVTGPPGTGKTVVLLLMAIQWLRCGHHVYVVSTWRGSRAACSMLYHLLLQTVKTQQSAGVSPGQPHLLLYDLVYDDDMKVAVNDLSQAATGGSLYVIADEVGSEWRTADLGDCAQWWAAFTV
ncbi:hypothetical protein C0Q70_18446 [Pomacea canaliculata]|uniref:Uncharacterized protein n=1 Tax=Pomacea canaliculata TaxID=400727 RepID=A0A2T7NN82_POMCA|nr:hypothetical protein C0Q70_18446 [Pomacea canaliculata]